MILIDTEIETDYLLIIGAFVPLTMNGNIMVDGILASCYASTDHDLAHIGMLPIRWFPTMIQWIFGEEDGFTSFVKMSKVISELATPDLQLYGGN